MAQSTASEGLAPVLIDLGKVKGKTIRQFKEGYGKIADEVRDVVAEVRQDPEAATRELLPVVIVYRRKRRRRRGGRGGMFGL